MSKIKSAGKKLRPAFPKLILLLVKFVLIEVGTFPLWGTKVLIYTLIFLLSNFRKGLNTLVTPLLKISFKRKSKRGRKPLPKIKQHHTYLFHTRGRGRPRTTPFFPFYFRKLKKIFNIILPKKLRYVLAFTFIIFVIYFYTKLAFTLGAQLPSPEKLITPIQPLTTQIYDRNGNLLYRLYEGRNRTLVKLGEVPPYLIQATLSAEDQNFYNHPGIDAPAIIRAFISNLRYGHQEGASTLTQQLIKNTLLTPEKTYWRKIKEIILSLWTERLFAKNDILQMYLNEVAYGGTAWGIDAASETYFSKKASELTLAQAAFLAGLPASPTQFSPYGPNPSLSKIRQRWVLDRMVAEGYIKKTDADLAYSEDLHIQPQINNIKAPHFVMYVRDLLNQKYGPRVVSQGGLKVITSLDLKLQEDVERIVYEEVAKLGSLNVRNGAAMITDPKTGQILAMNGSHDYHDPIDGSFNVTTALRQPGSSIKPITFATAFKKGYSPGNTILDAPVVFRDAWGNSYAPLNYDGKFHGPVSLRVALGSSYNTTAVRLLATLGLPSVLETSKDLGITTFTQPERYGLSLTLGGAEVKMVDMMTAFGTFANGGKRADSTAILKVTDSNGNVLEEAENKPVQVLQPEVAYLISNVLADNNARTPAFGPKSLLVIPGHSVPVKTGTSDNKKDNWTFGYTPDYAVGVWVGNNDGSLMNPRLTSGVTGAAPIWNRIMTSILSGKPDVAFEKPAGITVARVDGRVDLVVSGAQAQGLVKSIQRDGQTFFSDPFSSYATPAAQAAVNNGGAN